LLNTYISVNAPVVLTATLAPEAARAIILTCLQVVGLLYPICRSNSCQRCCSRRSVGGLTPPNNSETDELTGVEQVVINGKTYLLVDQDGSNGGYQHVLDTIVTIARSLSDTFAGIAPAGVAVFIVAQLAECNSISLIVGASAAEGEKRNPAKAGNKFTFRRNSPDSRGSGGIGEPSSFALSVRRTLDALGSKRDINCNLPAGAADLADYQSAPALRQLDRVTRAGPAQLWHG
jgi:hypothetical protein